MMGMGATQVFALAAVCLAVVAVNTASAETTPGCKGSKEFLCQSILTAKRCGVVQHCKSLIWNGQKPKAAPCQYGGVFVKRAQLKTMHISDHATKLDTIAALCSDLDAQAMHLCKSLVVEAGPETVQLINSTVIPPVIIGSILGLCSQDIQSQPQVKDLKICIDCKAFLKDIENGFIGPSIQEKMRERMELVCREVPDSFYTMCKHMSEDWIKHFFLYMNEEMNLMRVCDMFLPCETPGQENLTFSEVFNKIKTISNPLSDVTCKTCKEVMSDIRDFLKTPLFQTEAEDVMAATICNLMPHHMIRECKRRIMRYGNLIFDVIIAGFDTQLTCEAVRMCRPTEAGLHSSSLKGAFKVVFKAALKNFLPDTNMLPMFEIFGGTFGGTECSLCQLLFREMERVIADEHSKTQILMAVYEACNLLPEPWMTECVKFVKMNGNKIIDDILHNLPPKEICLSFGFCDDHKVVRHKRDTTIYVISEDKDSELPTPMIKPQNKKDNSEPAQTVTQGGSAWCQICEQIAGIVQRILGSQQLNLGVDTVYNQVCGVLPKSFVFRCARLSKHLINGVLGGISSVAQPRLICGAIGVCDMDLTPMNYSVPLPDLLKPPYN